MAEIMSNSVTFEYDLSPDYEVIPISGAVGGVTAEGMVLANVYHERAGIPEKHRFRVNPDGTLGELLAQEGKDAIHRRVFFGLYLTPGVARSLARWLNEKAAEIESRSMRVSHDKVN